MARSAPRTVRYGVIEWYPSGIGFTAKVNFLAAFITASPFFPGAKTAGLAPATDRDSSAVVTGRTRCCRPPTLPNPSLMIRCFWWIPRAGKFSGHRTNAFHVGSAIRVAAPGSLFQANRPEVPASSYLNKKRPREKGT